MSPKGLAAQLLDVASDVPEQQLLTVCKRLDEIPTNADLAEITHRLGSMPVLGLVERVRSLASVWKLEHPGAPFSGLAAALSAISKAETVRRSRERTDLVWTGPRPDLGSVRRTEQALTEVIDGAKKQLWLVSFVGYDVPRVAKALRRAYDRSVDVQIVMETPEDSDGKLRHSGLDAFPTRLVERMSVFVWPRERRQEDEHGNIGKLHAKVALADRRNLFVTSANLTGHAMELNMELGLLVKGGTMPKRAGELFQWLVTHDYWRQVL